MARTLGEGIVEGVKNYTAVRNANTNRSLSQMKTLMELQKMKSLSDPAPAGYVRDQASGRLVKDLTLSPAGQPKPLNELQQAKLDEMRGKQAQAQQVKENQDENLRSSAEDIIKTIGEVKKGKDYFGRFGDISSTWDPKTLLPGEYDRRSNWEANIKKLTSQAVLDTMTKLKQASRTGSTGFGALSEKELALLQSASTVLNRKLSPDQAMKYLDDLENVHRKVLNGGSAVPSNQGVSGQVSDRVGQSFNSPEEADASGLPSGSVVTVQGRRYQI